MTPQSIYTFYYLSKAFHEDRVRPYNLLPYLADTAADYLGEFTSIVRGQIRKYINLKRVDQGVDFSNLAKAGLPELLEMMKHTFRTPKPGRPLTRNVDWEKLIEWLAELEKLLKVKSPDSAGRLIFLIDRIHNTVHNTRESMLTKLANGHELLRAFDYASASTTTPEDLRSKGDAALIDKLVDKKPEGEADPDNMSIFDKLRAGLLKKESLSFNEMFDLITG